ncbi:NAD(P)/FAD-dependent oxidoreductase [Parasulfitobacter algicola]|uniref:FAD-dependent oxidoreductase n=1 Tax=Parasulfitobacter algicola TaxID=2614809 RepID=A0ABX2IW40_9RHOB|nr:FAD-dependent oxidoreductase [Sulfitobacter algicola]NSX54418.1 FAD-dependent oxidoreductase [Sulfitobacter algicola]
MTHIAVIGAGQAGASLVAKLRTQGFDGDITLLGEEPEPPYQRPPLSKAYLLGDIPKERLYLRPLDFYEDQKITLRLGCRVKAINANDKIIDLGDQILHYDMLALTTGSRPRRLPDDIGGGLSGVHTVRNLADVDRIMPGFQAGKKILIVGGGYIGLEAAAVAAKKGQHVTLIEMADRILKRVAAPQTSDYFRTLHQSHGVDLREGVGLKALTGDDTVTGVQLADGSYIKADMAIVGVGVEPCSQLAEQAGLILENGIRVDAQGQTSDPFIWAAGDCASLPYRGARIRLESVQNAIDQAEAVACNMLGAQIDYDPKPWFWSDQYDVKLQIAGLNLGYDAVVVRPSDTRDGQSHWYYAGNTLLAVDAMNDARNYMIGKRLIEAGKSPAPDIISNPDTDMKALLRG